MIDVGGPDCGSYCHIWTSGPGFYENMDWASYEEHASKQHSLWSLYQIILNNNII